MKVRNLNLKILALCSLFLLCENLFALIAPPYLRIRSIRYAGSGCPAGSVSKTVSSDALAFTLLFDSFIAEVGPGVPLINSRKNCQITIDLEFPSGWSFSIMDVDYRGFASLEYGVIGLQQSSYYFQGYTQTATLGTPFYGPIEKDYLVRDTLPLEAMVWSPCGAKRALNINTQVRLNNTANKRGRGILTVDSIDGQISHIYRLAWKICR